MKRLQFGFYCWLLFLTSLTLNADGFIIINHDGIIPPRPGPPIRPRPPIVRHYPFAPLEVSYHHVDVKIDNQVSITSIDQEFYNPNAQRLEGTYIFPMPKGAVLNKFSMEIDGKTMEAELLSADKARQIYEDIVRQMKDPALMEYAGQGAFKVRIYPIEPRGKKQIKLKYTQVLKLDSGLVRYVYPLNTEKFSAKPIPSISINIELASSLPLKTVYSPSHEVNIKRIDDKHVTIKYETKSAKPDTDFELLYSQDDAELGVNLITQKSTGEEGFFLMFLNPNYSTKISKPLPKDIALVLDTSGSMSGAKLVQAKKALRFCIENLNLTDRFEIIRFSTEVEPLFNKLVEASPDNQTKAFKYVDSLSPIGSTAIDEAVQKALSMRPEDDTRPYYVIFLTDGRPTIGITDEDQIVKRVAGFPNAIDQGKAGKTVPRVFCFGLGNDVNTHLLDKITETTRAFSQYVLPEEDLEVKLSQFYMKIKEPVLTEMQIQFPDWAGVSKMYPTPLPDLFKGEQLILAGTYKGSGDGTVTLTGMYGGNSKKSSYSINFPEKREDNDFVPRVWANRRVGYLLDQIRLHGEHKEIRDEVTELARRYGIVTPYTAYLIVEDEKQRNVPDGFRSLQTFHQDREARAQANQAYTDLKSSKTGINANMVARYGLAMQSSTVAGSGGRGLQESDALYFQRNGVSTAPTPSSAGRGGGSRTVSPQTPVNRIYTTSSDSAPLSQAIQQTRFVRGKTFYQNDSSWIDSTIQHNTGAKRIKIQFNSAEYFQLLSKKTEIPAWLALGTQVQFILDGQIYEIYE